MTSASPGCARAPAEPPCGDYVVMRVAAAALAWPDITMATGEYPVPVAMPYVRAGSGGRGRARRRPALDRQRVAGFTPQPFGSFAEARRDRADDLEAPPGMSDDEAAAFLIAAHRLSGGARRGGMRRARPCSCSAPRAACPRPRSSSVWRRAAGGGRGRRGEGGVLPPLGAHLVIDHQAEDFVAAVEREVGAGTSTRSSTSCRASRAGARGLCSRSRVATSWRVTPEG